MLFFGGMVYIYNNYSGSCGFGLVCFVILKFGWFMVFVFSCLILNVFLWFYIVYNVESWVWVVDRGELVRGKGSFWCWDWDGLFCFNWIGVVIFCS